MTKAPPPQRWPLYAVVAACLSTAVVAFTNAVGWYGHPVGGMFVDPGGVVSNFGLPEWAENRQGLRFPDVLLEVEGRPLVGNRGEPRARVFDEAVHRAAASADRGVDVRVQSS